MGTLTFNGSSVGTTLQELLMSDDIRPGSAPSYQLCKNIYLYHPLGSKMVDYPVDMAMSKERMITVTKSPEDAVVEQFKKVWTELGCDDYIKNTLRQSRIYGVSSVAYGVDEQATDEAIPLENLHSVVDKLYFSVFDPLNTAGSLVLNQDPLSKNFQQPEIVAVNGKKFHPSRSCVIFNEDPIYISFTSSAYGFVGRSVYQRALFPMKTFIQSMITDDLVTKKAGVLIAKMKAVGSFVDNIMQSMAAFKRNLLNESQTGNTISVDTDESIETLNMQNIDLAMTTPRKNVLENIALAAKMPAKILNAETFAEGFGEGTEDAKNVARFITNFQENMQPVYNFFDKIVMYCAWTPEFYATMQAQFPDQYPAKMTFTEAFIQWKNSFKAVWPNFLIEPDAEKIKTEDIKLKAIISLLEKLLPNLDPENKAKTIQWAIDNFNAQKLLFENPLVLDCEILQKWLEENQELLNNANQGQNNNKGGLGEL